MFIFTIFFAFIFAVQAQHCSQPYTVNFEQESSTLKITGGELVCSQKYVNSLPWTEYKKTAKIVQISNMITVPDFAFHGFVNLESVIFDDSLTTEFGDSSFASTKIKEIEIPSSVQKIGNKCFFSCSHLEKVTFAEGSKLTTIESEAFQFCKKLLEIALPDSLEEIKTSTFFSCEGMQTLSVGKNLKNIHSRAFDGCFSLENIIISDENQHFEVTDNVIFTKNAAEKTLVYYAIGNTQKEYTIPEGTTIIGDEAFLNSNLQKVILPKSLKKIGDYAFMSNLKLQEIIIHENVISIGKEAFSNCASLERIIFHKNIL